MRHTLRRLSTSLAAAIAATALAAGAAAADPVNAPNSTLVALDCGTAGTYQVVVNGNGDWTPGHDLNSNRILIPVAFGETTFTLTDPNGTVLFEGTDPAMSRRHTARGNRTLVECSYTFSFTEDGNTATVSGTVTGFVSGRKSSA